jgi:4-methyl-5(b-hydroxyethyl)-thiazole monophosphate biosynthesis
VEEIEFVTPVDILRRAGIEVVAASMTGSLAVTGRSGIGLTADVLWEDIEPDEFDALLIPGGPGVKDLRRDGRASGAAAAFAAGNKPVAAICAAPSLLGDAGLLENRAFTGHSSLIREFPALDPSHATLVSDGIITSRGAGTALDFALTLVEILAGPETRGTIARDIML